MVAWSSSFNPRSLVDCRVVLSCIDQVTRVSSTPCLLLPWALLHISFALHSSRYAPTAHELQGLHLEWLPAQGGVAASPNLPPELLHEVEQTRKCFFPEKVAWLHDKVTMASFSFLGVLILSLLS